MANKQKEIELFELEHAFSCMRDQVEGIARSKNQEIANTLSTNLDRLLAEIKEVMLQCSIDSLPIESYIDTFTDMNEVQQFLWAQPNTYANMTPFSQAADAMIAVFNCKDDLRSIMEAVSDPVGHKETLLESLDEAEEMMFKMRGYLLDGRDNIYRTGQKERAEKKRSVILPLVEELARINPTPEHATPQKVWHDLLHKLEDKGHDPEEIAGVIYYFNKNDKQKPYKFSTFKKDLSAARKKLLPKRG